MRINSGLRNGLGLALFALLFAAGCEGALKVAVNNIDWPSFLVLCGAIIAMVLAWVSNLITALNMIVCIRSLEESPIPKWLVVGGQLSSVAYFSGAAMGLGRAAGLFMALVLWGIVVGSAVNLAAALAVYWCRSKDSRNIIKTRFCRA